MPSGTITNSPTTPTGGGALNHDAATEGDWSTRKNNAARAYHEWLPIRTDASGNLLKIYRRFEFGNQEILARMWFPASVLQAQNTASSNPTPYTLDAWNAYPLPREAILQTLKAQGKSFVTLSGDSHNAWFTEVTTLAGEQIGVEFAIMSVTSASPSRTAPSRVGTCSSTPSRVRPARRASARPLTVGSAGTVIYA